MNEDDERDDELLLDQEIDESEAGFEEEAEDQQGDDEVVIAFSDDETEEETPLVKRLREQLRESQRQSRRVRNQPDDTDPEPKIIDRPRSLEDYDYDQARYDAAVDEYYSSKEAHSAWKARQEERERGRKNVEAEQGKRIEQQKNALGVSDYEPRANTVRETLSDQQLAVLVNGVDNPAQLIYALGRSPTRLSLLAGEDNLAKFAVKLGKMEKEIKVTKKSAPAPETRVRGATAQNSPGAADKREAQLEAQAAKTGDRSALIAYRQKRNKAA